MKTGSPVYVKTYKADENPGLEELNLREILRYSGMTRKDPSARVPADDDEARICELIDECFAEVSPLLEYRVCYRYIPVEWETERMILPFDVGGSRDLARNLNGCTEAVMFAATIGIGIDRLIARYNRTSPAGALILQALGAERAEALCNLFNAEIRSDMASRGLKAHPRFSPGFGDLRLDVQRDFMRMLDCAHLIGVNLNESLLMSPSKSVTAFIGGSPA